MVDEIIQQRRTTHGPFSQVARTETLILLAFEDAPNWRKLSDVQRSSMRMMAHKMARILCGDPSYEDHWKDIQGYAKLGGAP